MSLHTGVDTPCARFGASSPGRRWAAWSAAGLPGEARASDTPLSPHTPDQAAPSYCQPPRACAAFLAQETWNSKDFASGAVLESRRQPLRQGHSIVGKSKVGDLGNDSAMCSCRGGPVRSKTSWGDPPPLYHTRVLATRVNSHAAPRPAPHRQGAGAAAAAHCSLCTVAAAATICRGAELCSRSRVSCGASTTSASLVSFPSFSFHPRHCFSLSFSRNLGNTGSRIRVRVFYLASLACRRTLMSFTKQWKGNENDDHDNEVVNNEGISTWKMTTFLLVFLR